MFRETSLPFSDDRVFRFKLKTQRKKKKGSEPRVDGMEDQLSSFSVLEKRVQQGPTIISYRKRECVP